MNIQETLKRITAGQDLTGDEMLDIMRQIMTGQLTASQIGGFLIGLGMKGESIEEISAAATVMRELVTTVHVDVPNLIDVVGTGGDGTSSFNVSTASAFIAVAAGAHVAKHGNRAASGKCGSADLLECAGARIDLSSEQIAECVKQTGFGFMLAPAHHTAMKHAIGARKELGVRTIFNVLGPLTNPAHVNREMMGVFSADLVEPLAHVLKKLGSEHVMVVHSEDGMDEISVSSSTLVAELKNGSVKTYTISPDQFGVPSHAMDQVTVANPDESLAVIRSVFEGVQSAASAITAMNAGAAIYVAGLADDLADGIGRARELIRSGVAVARFDNYVEFTNSF